jgi:hypothetical protein
MQQLDVLEIAAEKEVYDVAEHGMTSRILGKYRERLIKEMLLEPLRTEYQSILVEEQEASETHNPGVMRNLVDKYGTLRVIKQLSNKNG